ncbi:baseplate assembly protein, partial [Escherichia coli]
VVVMSLAGNRSSAVVVASGHQSYRINGLNSGEVVVYNQWGQYVRLGEDGIVVEASGQQVLVNSATTLEVTATDGVTLKTPSLKVTGDITDNCESNSTTLKALREAYNDHTHPVSGVESGGSTVTSQATTETV